jgi:hypothetical protein
MTRFRPAQPDLTLVVGNSTKVVCLQALILQGAGVLGAISNTDMEKRKLKLFDPQHFELLMRSMHPPGFQSGMPCVVCKNPMRTPCRGICRETILYAQALDGQADIHISFCMRPHHVSCHPTLADEPLPPHPTKNWGSSAKEAGTRSWNGGDGPVVHGSNGMGDLN